MTRLLVSVRDAAEAHIALRGGADLIDVKEPLRGALGAADPEQVAEVLAAVDGQVPVSVALGELLSQPIRPALAGLSFVKWGLAGAADRADWVAGWRQAMSELPQSVSPVAVMYADWQTAHSPTPREFLAECRTGGMRVLLIDTFDKSGGSLLEVWPISELRPFVAAARDLGMMIVLGGSLSLACLPAALTLKPDYIAVRGAVCRGGREGTIDEARVRELRIALDQNPKPS